MFTIDRNLRGEQKNWYKRIPKEKTLHDPATCNTNIDTWEPNTFGTSTLRSSREPVKLVPRVHKPRRCSQSSEHWERHRGKARLGMGHQQIKPGRN